MPIRGGSVAARGFNDHDRLVAGELVYMGLTRTPIASIADRVPFRGSWATLMNEYFATIADVWRVLDALPSDLDQHATADNRPKDREASIGRLARMVGLDAADANDSDWLALASWLAEMEMRRIEDGLHLVQSACGLPLDAPVDRSRGRAVRRRADRGAAGSTLDRFRLADRRHRRDRPLGQHLRAGGCRRTAFVREPLDQARHTLVRAVVGRDPLHQPVPGLALLGAGGLVDGDLEIVDLAHDLGPRQHVEAACQNRRLDDRRLGAVEAAKEPVVVLARRPGSESEGRWLSSATSTTASSAWASAASSRGTGTSLAGQVGQSRRPVRQPAKILTSSVQLAIA